MGEKLNEYPYTKLTRAFNSSDVEAFKALIHDPTDPIIVSPIEELRTLGHGNRHGSPSKFPVSSRCLVRHGADQEYEYDMSRQTKPYDCCLFPESCLSVAVARGDEEMTRVLLDLGAYPYRKDLYGRDPEFWHTYRASNPNPKSIICDLFACRRAFHALKDDLHRELIQYIFHPARLQRLGYFELNRT